MRDSTLRLYGRVIARRGASKQRRIRFQVQRHVALQENRAGEIRAGRKIDRSATGGGAAVDRLLDRLGAKRLPSAAAPNSRTLKICSAANSGRQADSQAKTTSTVSFAQRGSIRASLSDVLCVLLERFVSDGQAFTGR